MKKATFIFCVLLLSLAAQPLAHGNSPPKAFTVVIAGGEEPNEIEIWLTADGRQFVIDSIGPLEAGGSVCTNPEGKSNELVCQAPIIGGFQVNAGAGDDRVSVAKNILIPVTIQGNGGNDTLIGGAGPDRLIGGNGNDRLLGGAGGDWLAGGPGNDMLVGGPGDDLLTGGPGKDILAGGPGRNAIRQSEAPHPPPA